MNSAKMKIIREIINSSSSPLKELLTIEDMKEFNYLISQYEWIERSENKRWEECPPELII